MYKVITSIFIWEQQHISIELLQSLFKNFEFNYALDIQLDHIIVDTFYIIKRRILTVMWFLFYFSFIFNFEFQFFFFLIFINVLDLFVFLIVWQKNFVGYMNLNKVIAPRVIPMAERGHYRTEEVTPSDSKATSVAHYHRRSYCRERVSKKRLALT